MQKTAAPLEVKSTWDAVINWRKATDPKRPCEGWLATRWQVTGMGTAPSGVTRVNCTRGGNVECGGAVQPVEVVRVPQQTSPLLVVRTCRSVDRWARCDV